MSRCGPAAEAEAAPCPVSIGRQQVAEVIPGSDRRYIPEIMVFWNDDPEDLEFPFGQRGINE